MYKRGCGSLKEIKMVKKAIKGDDDAFLSLMMAHREALFRTALAYLKNENDALEAIQEVTVRAYEKIHTLKKPQYAKTWLIRIMMNYCCDLLHKKQRVLLDEAFLLQQGIHVDYTYLEVEEALRKLTDEQRDLIYMRYLHEIKIKDLAEMTAIPESTIKTRLYKALTILRSHLAEKGEMGDV